jgi:hypothetical protein
MSLRLTNLLPRTELPTGSTPDATRPPYVSGRGLVRALTGNDAVALAVKQVSFQNRPLQPLGHASG